MKKLVAEDPPPGVLAYDGDEVVGWAAVHPREDTTFAKNRKIPPHVDETKVWSVWCIRVRPGHRGKGISHELLRGAIDFAKSHGAPAIEGYPVDNKGGKVDLTMAYVGTRRLFEKAGFKKVAETTSVLNGFPRVLMRLDLNSPQLGRICARVLSRLNAHKCDLLGLGALQSRRHPVRFLEQQFPEELLAVRTESRLDSRQGKSPCWPSLLIKHSSSHAPSYLPGSTRD